MIWETLRAIYPFDLFIVILMVWTMIQIAGLFPALQYWLALRVTYILPPLPEDTAHLTDRPGKKSENGKSKDSMVVRYGKVTAYELTRVEKGAMFGFVLTVTQGLFLGVAFVWVLHQLPEPFTLLRSAVTPVLIVAAVTCQYVAVSISLLGDATSSYKWQLSSIFGIVFGCLSFAFLLENTDELLDIPLYQGLDEEFTRRFNLPLFPGEDDDDTEFDRRQSLTRVILALVTALLAFCHFFASARRAVYHRRLVNSEFHGKFFKGLEYLYLALLPVLIVMFFRAPTEFATEFLHLDKSVDDTCHTWLGHNAWGAVLCRTITWTGLGARDWYHTLRWAVQGSVVALSLLLFRPVLSAYTHRVASVMRGLLLVQQLYGGNTGQSLHALMQREAADTMQGLGAVCVEVSALPLLLVWHWHYAGHWLVDYLTVIALLAHWLTLLLTFLALTLSGTDAHRPAFFDTLLQWWDRVVGRDRAGTPRNNKKLRAKKKHTAMC
eukprot:TRINITY_DN3561_c0_g1_i1.p1 TRINITY_DN3561_c0_g1~~TRINITY_DN3561_c0_g1_i1.p1  ORF type:complete len:493 (+),score=136.57 TRINITY_DN3561_c0_g1_i1:128-1606(+)